MELHEYQDAYYQIKDEVIESLPLEEQPEALSD